jgi:glycerol-3-phosphate dehydrogenase
MPITEQIYGLLYESRPVELALGDLLGRERRAERDVD